MDFEQLDVYKLAEKLGNEIWGLVIKWKHFEKDTLGKQITRSADSIAVNIAEGSGRGSYQDNRRFVRMARASLLETRHWLRQAYTRKLVSGNDVAVIRPIVEELSPRLNAYLNSIGKQIINNKEQRTKNKGQGTNNQ